MYVDHEIADGTSAMQQIMPYILLQSDKGNYFTHTLTFDDMEMTSMGFCNHITPVDGTTTPLFKGAIRTFFEEISYDDAISTPMEYVGTIRDMSHNDKHLGYVFVIKDVNEESIRLIAESENHKGKWMSRQDLIHKYSKLENWSKHIVNFLVDKDL